MSTARIVILAALALLLLSGTAFGISEAFRAERHTRTVVTDDVKRIVVNADSGDVDLRAGLTGDVVIARHDSWLLDKPSVTERFQNGTLTIDARCGGLRSVLRCRSDLMIDLPPEVDVQVRTSAGDVDLRGLSGRADVQTDSGDIKAHRLEPITIRASTDAGDVSLDLFGQPARTEARSQAGNVSVRVPYGPYRIDAESDGGNAKVDGLIRDDLAPQAISAGASAGDTVVRAR